MTQSHTRPFHTGNAHFLRLILTPNIAVDSDGGLFEPAAQATSATAVLPSIDRKRLCEAQQAKYGSFLAYSHETSAGLPHNETPSIMSYNIFNDGLRFHSYLPGHLQNHSVFRRHFVFTKTLFVGVVFHACHDRTLSGRHPAYKPTERYS